MKTAAVRAWIVRRMVANVGNLSRGRDGECFEVFGEDGQDVQHLSLPAPTAVYQGSVLTRSGDHPKPFQSRGEYPSDADSAGTTAARPGAKERCCAGQSVRFAFHASSSIAAVRPRLEQRTVTPRVATVRRERHHVARPRATSS